MLIVVACGAGQDMMKKTDVLQLMQEKFNLKCINFLHEMKVTNDATELIRLIPKFIKKAKSLNRLVFALLLMLKVLATMTLREWSSCFSFY